MTNLEFYKEEIEKRYHYINTQSNGIFAENLMMAIDDVYRKFGLSSMSILDWLCDEHQILNEKEKEYLSAVIKPFRDEILYIVKHNALVEDIDYQYISIGLSEPNMNFPTFRKGTMYKGMKLNKEYTLEDLGL